MDAPVTEKSKRSSRGWLMAGISVIVVLVTAVTTVYLVREPTSSEPACEPHSYRKTSFDEKIRVAAASPNGKYAIGRRAGYIGGDVLLWHDGKVTRIENVPGDGGLTYPTDVNDSGTVIGYTESADDGDVSWVYEDGDFRILKGANGEKHTTAKAINNDGTIVGGEDIDKADWIWGITPVKWEPGAIEATRLMDDAVDGEAADISDDGTIVGSVHVEDPDDSARTDAWWWTPDGRGEPLMSKLPTEDREEMGDGHSDASFISGDWIYMNIARVNIADDFAAEKVEGVRPAAIDDRGRVFGLDDDDNVVVFDDKPTILPGLDDPPHVSEEDAEAGEDVGANDVMAVSRDGSVVFGYEWTDQGAMWTTCR